MEKEKHHIDNYFKDNLKDLNPLPPNDVWSGIERELDRKHRTPSVFIWIGLAAGIALMIGFGWLFTTEHINNSRVKTREVADKTKSGISTPQVSILNNNLSKHNSISNDTSKIELTENTAIKTDLNVNQNSPDTIRNSEIVYLSGSLYLVNGNSSGKQNEKIGIISDSLYNNLRNKDLTKLKSISFILEQTHLAVNPLSALAGQTTSPLKNKLPTNKEKPEKTLIRRWSIEAQLAPTYAYRSITQAGSNQSISEYSNETGLVAYSAIVKVNYQLNNKLYIQAGVGFSMLGYNNNDTYLYQSSGLPQTISGLALNPSITGGQKYFIIHSSAFSNINNIQGYTTASIRDISLNQQSTYQNANFVQQMNYIEIPLILRYRLLGNKVSVHLLGGLGTQVLLSSSGYVSNGTIHSSIPETSSSLFHTFNLSSTMGIGLNYRLPNQAVFVIEPTYKYFINSITNSNINSNSVHPYTFGIYTGLTFNF